MITATPVKFEIYDGEEWLATLDMFDEGGSHIEIKTVVAPANWPELSSVIQDALELMHPTQKDGK